MGQIQATIEDKLQQALKPEYIEVLNESDKHNVPAGSESHFKVILVTPKFEGQELIDRHREVNQILNNELNSGVHALSLQTLTPAEWRIRGKTSHQTPPCLGGSKKS